MPVPSGMNTVRFSPSGPVVVIVVSSLLIFGIPRTLEQGVKQSEEYDSRRDSEISTGGLKGKLLMIRCD